MKLRWQVVIAIAAYVVVMSMTAPATLLDAGLRRLGDARMRLIDAHGTVWSGAGRIEIRDDGGRTGVGKSVVWRILPESLLRGRLVIEVSLGQATRPFPVVVSYSSVDIANADITLPASAMGLGIPRLVPLGLTGELLVHVRSLSISPATIRGDATVNWRNAGSLLTQVAPLGDYELVTTFGGTAIEARLRTLRGPLQLEGNGDWSDGKAPRYRVDARVAEQQQPQLGPLLRLIALERGDGWFELASR